MFNELINSLGSLINSTLLYNVALTSFCMCSFNTSYSFLLYTTSFLTLPPFSQSNAIEVIFKSTSWSIIYRAKCVVSIFKFLTLANLER